MPVFSAQNRKSNVDRIKNVAFDLIIIGGGITGAGIAWDASLRGLKVLLLEQNDFASGTSSKSTKLIHGGLRYLKQLKFKQVYEVGRERAIVHNIARFLVRPEKMLLPIYKGGSLNRLMAGVALAVYDALAGVEKADAFSYSGKEKTKLMEPMLPGDNLLGSFLYAEYQTDDNRLTWSLLQSAIEKGAFCLNYSKVIGLIKKNNSIIDGIIYKDVLSGEVHQIHSPLVINAAGPWVMDVLDLDSFPPQKELLLSKGTHIVFPYTKLPFEHSIYMDDPDKKRMIFAIPRDGITYLGTTDILYQGDKNNIMSTVDEIDYLLHTINTIIPSSSLSPSDILSSWVGVRPLIMEKGKSSTEISRKDEIFISKSGLISIAGGKLTGFRKMAEKVLNKSFQIKGTDYKKFKHSSTTKSEPLSGNSFKSEQDLNVFLDNLKNQFHNYGLDESLAASYLRRYGDKAAVFLTYLDVKNEKKSAVEKLLEAEIKYGVFHEMVFFPADFIQRQTGYLWFNRDLCLTYRTFIVDIYANLFSWSKENYKVESIKYDLLLNNAIDFKA
jgi:glycerol-3-phosphate dehydrogenase